MRRNLIPVILVTLGVLARFLFIWYPAEVVFDEVHFGKFVSAYFDGKYYFDIHPPLGKLLIAGFAKFFGFRAGFDFDKIGEGYGDIPYVALRFLPNLFGALVPLTVFLWLGAMGISRMAAGFAAFLLLFDNAMLVQSHFILVDSMLLFFGFLGLWLFWRARKRGYRLGEVFVAGVVLALSFSVKWTGLAFFGLALVVMLVDWGREHLKALRAPALFIGISFIVYLSIFWLHFALLPNPGPGDAYMSAGFAEKSFAGKFTELNRAMFSYNSGLRAEHPYASPVWTWPLMIRPVYFWVSKNLAGDIGRIYLFGNPVVWWLSTIGLFAALFLWRGGEKKWILYAGYFLQTLPFFAVTRVTFLYHYLPALGFAAAILTGMLFDNGMLPPRSRRIIFTGFAALAIAGFLFFAPLSYGLPLSETHYTIRIWLPSWR